MHAIRAAHDSRHGSAIRRRAWQAATVNPVRATAWAGHAPTHGASQPAQPSPIGGAGGSSRSTTTGPPEPTMTAAPAPGSSPPSLSVETGAHAASNAGAAIGTTTLSPHPSSSRSSAVRVATSPIDFVPRPYFSWNGYGVVNP